MDKPNLFDSKIYFSKVGAKDPERILFVHASDEATAEVWQLRDKEELSMAMLTNDEIWSMINAHNATKGHYTYMDRESRLQEVLKAHANQ